MLKKFFSGLINVLIKALPALVKIFIAGFVSVSEHSLAKKRALERAEDEYAASGYHPAYMPNNPQPKKQVLNKQDNER